jgi:hypothetical protein
MSPGFQIDAGVFSIGVQLDDSGIRLERGGLVGTTTTSIPWGKITGATFVPPGKDDAASEQKDERIAQFLGPEAVQKFRELQGKVGQIFVAYRDGTNSLQQAEIPAPITDPAYLQEFQKRLGNRWFGETKNRDQVGRKLHTNPGFFKTVFVLVALFGIVAVIAVIGLFGFLGPVLNFMSIQKMLLDFQDGNFTSLGYRVATYVALFIMAFFLRRVIRGRLDGMKRARSPRSIFRP